MVFDLSGMLGTLSAARVPFVVIGGIAVAAHAFVRATEDLDLVPDPAHGNATSSVTSLRATRHGWFEIRAARSTPRSAETCTETTISPSLRRGKTSTSFSDSRGYRRTGQLAAASWQAELSGARFNVCSRAHLIAMKRARGAAIDIADLERLELT